MPRKGNTRYNDVPSSAVSSSENGEQREEEVDDIQIQGDRSPNVFIVRVSLDEVVCVIYDVATEYN